VTSTRFGRTVLCLLLVCATAVAASSCGPVEVRPAKPAARSLKTEGSGYRFESDGWTYLHVEGSPYEMGFQQGKLMAGDMDEVRKTSTHVFYHNSDLRWPHLAAAAEKLFAGKLGPDLEQEIRGISEGAKAAGVDFPLADVLALNGMIELTGYWWPNVASGKLPDVDAPTRCSAFLATGAYTSDGKPVMAHNTWSTYADAQFFNLITDMAPDRGHRILMQSSPGLVHSASDFFVTDAPLMGTETTISGIETFDPEGTPEFVRARRAMQFADSPDDFVRIMREGNNGGYANSWLLANAKTGEIVRFEQGLEHDAVERTGSGYFVGFNGPSDPDLRNLETSGSGYFNLKDSTCARRVRLEHLMKEHKGRIDLPAARAIIADHYDEYTREYEPGARTVEGRGDLDAREYTSGSPYNPAGAVDGKAMDAAGALKMSFQARWGSSSGMPFDAGEFLDKNPQYAFLKGYLRDRPPEPWVSFRAGMK